MTKNVTRFLLSNHDFTSIVTNGNEKKARCLVQCNVFHDSQSYKEIQGLANSPCFVLDLKIGISFRRANDRLFARMHVRKEPLKKQTLN